MWQTLSFIFKHRFQWLKSEYRTNIHNLNISQSKCSSNDFLTPYQELFFDKEGSFMNVFLAAAIVVDKNEANHWWPTGHQNQEIKGKKLLDFSSRSQR